jgi:hemolysin activation/secretion protein
MEPQVKLKEKGGSMFKKIVLFAAAIFLITFVCQPLFAEGPDEGEGEGEIIDTNLTKGKVKLEDLPIEISIKEKVEQERPKSVLPEGPIFIRQVNVTGVTVLAKKEVDDIISEFQNKEISGKEMQRCADQISDAYSLNGYITSYAYVDPSRLNQGILEIKCVEGKVGNIKIEGNHHFSTRVYQQRIDLKKGDVFNLKLLKNNVYRTSKHPDRKVIPKVQPQDTLESTDVLISVKDKLPLHAIFDHDNYGSESILYKRYKTLFIHNNITGHDDTLIFKVQRAESDAQRIDDVDYFLPLNNNWKWEFYLMPAKRENYYYGNLEQMDLEKNAYKWYTYFYQTVFSEPNRELIFNYGFVQKFIRFFWDSGLGAGQETSQDRHCALLWGFDYISSDDYGTWVITEDAEKGIPRMFGGSTAEDNSTTVRGGGNKYFKNKMLVARKQKLFWDIDLNLKTGGQYTTQALGGVNSYAIGGYQGLVDNRGYPRAELVMDSGYSLAGGLSFPAYFISKSAKFPACKTPVYKNLKLFTFMDYAKGYKRSRQPGDDRRKSIASAGCGFQLAIPEYGFSTRLDIGWILDHKVAKDGTHHHVLYKVTKTF